MEGIGVMGIGVRMVREGVRRGNGRVEGDRGREGRVEVKRVG